MVEVCVSSSSSSSWNRDENDQFEEALSKSVPEQEDGASTEPDWISFPFPGKTVTELKQHFDKLVDDVDDIEAGRVELPEYADVFSDGGGSLDGASGSSQKKLERRRGQPWSEEEHRQFLLGLERFGKSDWKSISRFCVKTRTPTQVASHAQKYFIRRESAGKKERRRNSIHDITSAQPFYRNDNHLGNLRGVRGLSSCVQRPYTQVPQHQQGFLPGNTLERPFNWFLASSTSVVDMNTFFS